MSATALRLVEPIEPQLIAGDRFELTDVARPKLRPKGSPRGTILGDAGEFWRVKFDGNVTARTICKSFIRPPTARQWRGD